MRYVLYIYDISRLRAKVDHIIGLYVTDLAKIFSSSQDSNPG
jgi:hypothetical protein